MTGQVKVQIDPTDIQLVPGGSPSPVHVEVFNGTNIVDQFWAGPFGGQAWLAGEPVTVNLYPEQQGSLELSLSIPGGRVVPAGTYPLTIRVVSASTRQIILDQPVRLQVMTVLGTATLKLEPSEVRGVRDARFVAEVGQTGNTALNVDLSGEDPQGALAFSFDPPTIIVPPLGVAQALCSVSARASYFGDELTHRFTVHARGPQQPLQSAGIFHQSAVFAPGRVRLLAIALTTIGGVVVALAALLSQLQWTTSGLPGRGVNYPYYAGEMFRDLPSAQSLGLPGPLTGGWVSGGALVTVLAVLAIVGALAGRKRLARICAAVIVVAMIAFLVSLNFAEGERQAGIGAYMALLGGVVALVGSLFVRPLGQGVKMPKLQGLPKVPSPR